MPRVRPRQPPGIRRDPSVTPSLSLCGCTAAAAGRRPRLAACLLAASCGEHRPVRPKPLSMRPPATADTGGRSGRRCCRCWQRSSDRPAHGRQRKAETQERRMGGRAEKKEEMACGTIGAQISPFRQASRIGVLSGRKSSSSYSYLG
ncbi:hypothetical protein GQ607_004702 [Colletotrichum asianum]|uniref:Uncharacterized protein n=1 Tax=Colletotrichum asianum TaxID=702518 RepID=A0A8H3WNS5_9PEZI|nr:hypothetical protein GQ607_004702 [Colletotrichum asianum]